MKSKSQTLWLILIVLIYGGWVVTPASAHAVLLRANPQPNAVMARPPVQVELFFSESLEPKLSSITVIDSNNLVVDAGDVRVDPADPTRMTVSLHTLTDGVYTVSWKALSAIDGHQTIGTYPFAVGDVDETALQSLQQSSTASLPFTALLAKFLLLASLAMLVGQRLFIALVWEPAFRREQVEQPTIWTFFYRIGLILALIAIGVGILSQAGQLTGSEISSPWNPHTGHILTETRLGIIWLARLLLAMLAVWLADGQNSSVKKWIGFAVNLALLFTVALTSHAATEVRSLLPILGDWLHLIGMTFWFGGLIHLFTGIRQLQQLDGQQRARLVSLLTSRFSVNAIVFVALLGLTGFYAAYLRVGSWSGLITTLYGHVLLIKQGFVAGLLIIAAVNLLVISPRLKHDRVRGVADSGVVARFGKILALELTLAGLLLASVSFLTYIPPARAVLPYVGLAQTKKVDDLKMDLSISPGRVGQNTFSLQLISSDGQPIRSAKIVLLRFTSLQGNLAPSELQLIGQGDGSFAAKGVNLSLPGEWQVQAVVRREEKFDSYAIFDFDLPGVESGRQTSTMLKLSGLLILLIGLVCGVLTKSIKAGLILYGAGLPLTVIMLGLGFYYLVRITPVENPQANPIAPDIQSVTAGQNLYLMHCARCHGEAGKGDGPLGVLLNPRPADLTQHAIPGVHTDAQLFEWITNGFPGSQMPPFKDALSDKDRWNLVNFIRTLAPK